MHLAKTWQWHCKETNPCFDLSGKSVTTIFIKININELSLLCLCSFFIMSHSHSLTIQGFHCIFSCCSQSWITCGSGSAAERHTAVVFPMTFTPTHETDRWGLIEANYPLKSLDLYCTCKQRAEKRLSVCRRASCKNCGDKFICWTLQSFIFLLLFSEKWILFWRASGLSSSSSIKPWVDGSNLMHRLHLCPQDHIVSLHHCYEGRLVVWSFNCGL